MSVKCIVAFQIPGKPGFITATKTYVDESDMCLHNRYLREMEPAPVKTTIKRDGVKYLWSRLRKRNGSPQDNPSYVVKQFNLLKKDGWEINDAPFRKRHFKNKRSL